MTNTSAQNTRCHDSNQHTQGLALCHRVILHSVAHRWVQAGHPRCTSDRTVKAVGGPTQAPRHDDRQTTTRQKTGLSQTCFQETSADRHLYSGAGSRSRRSTKASSMRRTRLCRTTTSRKRSHTSPTQSKQRFPKSSRRPTQSYQRIGDRYPGEDQPRDRIPAESVHR